MRAFNLVEEDDKMAIITKTELLNTWIQKNQLEIVGIIWKFCRLGVLLSFENKFFSLAKFIPQFYHAKSF